MLFVLWVGGTGMGHLLGAGISAQDLAAWGLDFVVTAVFVALAVSLWRGKSDLLPWVVAAGVSFGAYLVLPGTRWYILLGGLAGSIVGAFRDAD
jgi:predicted branched-subunit amino acid permease